MNSELKKRLEAVGQAHVLQFANELDATAQTEFTAQIEAIDLESIPAWVDQYVVNKPVQEIPEDLKPAEYYPINPVTDEELEVYAKAYEIGEKMISEGKVALCTVAGGQGTRLGFNGPKGTYPTSPIKNKSLFQLFAEQIIGLQKRYNCSLKWFVMTSIINNDDTQKFFEENDFFGLSPENVKFFVQGLMPVFDHNGKILLENKGKLAMSPDGHGGTLLAMKKSGALAEMIENDIEHLSYFQVDNPLVSVIDPLFMGLHFLTGSEVSSRSLTKTGPFEKLGNFCITDEKLTIIEYSDMPEELATKIDETGLLAFRAGSPAIHVFKRSFVERITDGAFSLPFHRADKKVPFVNDAGEAVEPTENNAVKLETFIFDTIPMAKNPIILEAIREEQFAPVKNKTGVDSAESCREMSQEKDASWLEALGLDIPRKADGTLNCSIEISKAVYPNIDALNGVPAPTVGTENYYG